MGFGASSRAIVRRINRRVQRLLNAAALPGGDEPESHGAPAAAQTALEAQALEQWLLGVGDGARQVAPTCVLEDRITQGFADLAALEQTPQRERSGCVHLLHRIQPFSRLAMMTRRPVTLMSQCCR